MRRGEEDNDSAKATSGGKDKRCEPNGASDQSKPEWDPPPATTVPLPPGLHLVATPIGNLADVSLRALAVLRGADRIFCEDTRVTRKLLAHYGIKAGSNPITTIMPRSLGQPFLLPCGAVNAWPWSATPGHR